MLLNNSARDYKRQDGALEYCARGAKSTRQEEERKRNEGKGSQDWAKVGITFWAQNRQAGRCKTEEGGR